MLLQIKVYTKEEKKMGGLGWLLKKSMVDFNHVGEANKFLYSIILQELSMAKGFGTR